MVDTVSQASTSTQGGKGSITKAVNAIFATKKIAPVKNLSAEFADGFKFQQLFNVIFDENVNCKLSDANTLDARVGNWNRINAVICFNYLHQQFYLIGSTMKALAQGKKGAASKVIRHLLDCTRGTQFENFLDSTCLGDIADVVEIEGKHMQDNEEDEEMLKKAKEELEKKGNTRQAAIVDDDLRMTADELKIYSQMKEQKQKAAQTENEQ